MHNIESSGFNTLESSGEQSGWLQCSSHQLITTWYETLSLFFMWSNLRNLNMSSCFINCPQSWKTRPKRATLQIYSAWLMCICDVFNISNCSSGVCRIKLIAKMPTPTFLNPAQSIYTGLFAANKMCFLVFLLLFWWQTYSQSISCQVSSLFYCLSVPLLLNLSPIFSSFQFSCGSRGGLWGGGHRF